MTGRRIAILGDGGWGTTLALVLLKNGHEVSVWGPFPEYIERIRAAGENENYLPGIRLPPALRFTADRAEAVGEAEIAVLAVPTRYFRSVMESFAGIVPASCRLVSVAKGLDRSTRKRMSEVAGDVLGHLPVAVLSGPSHAEEVARDIPTAVVMACADMNAAAELASVFMNPRFRVYTLADVPGVEFGAAFKNIIAVAAGVCDGIGFGDNTKAALITRGMNEVTRLGCALGADRLTFAGLSGMGDLIVTCLSKHSRNRAFGERLGRGESADAILGGMKQAVEGVWNCGIARDLAREAGVQAPITEAVCSLIHEGKDPHEAVESLLTRAARSEFD